VQFLIDISYVAAAGGLVLLIGAGVYFHRRLGRKDPDGQALEPRSDLAPLRQARRA
jgi:hypothetical protein